MPRTTFQKAIFGILMALAMVYGMEVYNAALRHGGVSNSSFAIPILEMVLLSAIVIALETLFARPLAKRLALKLVDPHKDRPIAVILVFSVLTVCCMCPMMSLVAVLLFKRSEGEWIAKWIQTVALNFPMALCWQLFIAGPLVRLVFRKMFAVQLQPSIPA